MNAKIIHRYTFDYFHPAWTEIIYNYTILIATIDCSRCDAGVQMGGNKMIVEMSERIGQLKIEAYEEIVWLIMAALNVIQCLINKGIIKMRYHA